MTARARAALLVGVLAAAFCFGQLALTFRGLEASDAFNYAQVARNLARGRGYVTQEAMPYELALFGGVPRPELMHPPLQALAIAVGFAIAGVREWVVALPGAISYVLTAPLVYLTATRLAGGAAAAGVAAGALFLTHPGSADYTTSGLAESLYAFLLTASVILIAATCDERRLPVMLLVGACLGLTDLSRETARYLLPAAAILLWGARPGREARLTGLFAGYLMVTWPNFARIAAATGTPFASNLGSILMCDIPPFYGLRWYRSMSEIDPFGFLSQAPHLLARKVTFNSFFLAATLPSMVSPLLLLGAAAAWRWSAQSVVGRAAILTIVALVIQTGVTVLFKVDLRHFAPFVPLLSILTGIAAHMAWLRLPRPYGLAAIATVVMLVLIQGGARLAQFQPRSDDYLAARNAERALGGFIEQNTAPHDLVISDISEIVAWEADRRTVWYPLDEETLAHIPDTGRGRQFLFLTSRQVKPEPANPLFGVRQPEPWVRYLTERRAPDDFELISEFRISGVEAILCRRKSAAVPVPAAAPAD